MSLPGSEVPLGFNDPIHSNWRVRIVVEDPQEGEHHSAKKQKTEELANESSADQNSTIILVNSLILSRQSEFFRYVHAFVSDT